MYTHHTNLNVGELGSKATTQIDGFNINSACKFNGRILLNTGDAICTPGGTKFISTDINCEFTTFVNALGAIGHKRLRYLYFGVDTTGPLSITVFIDGDQAQVLTVTPVKTGRQFIRVKAGRGSRGSFIHVKVENTGGCWFALDQVQVLPQYLPNSRA